MKRSSRYSRWSAKEKRLRRRRRLWRRWRRQYEIEMWAANPVAVHWMGPYPEDPEDDFFD